MSPETPGRSELKGPLGANVVYLLDVATDLEVRILRSWLRRNVDGRVETMEITSSRRGRGGDPVEIAKRVSSGANLYFIPLRVVWMAPEREGRRSVAWWDLLVPGDPRDPRGIRAYWIRALRPARVRRIVGEGAGASQLLEAYEQADEVDGVGVFVTRRAWRTLDKVERKLRGNRYKIPRFVPEAILARREFREAVAKHAADTGADPHRTRNEAERYLHEIAATHSPYVIDLIAAAIHVLYRQGYGQIRYRPDEVARVAELGQTNPVVFLPSHRSNLDRLSLQFTLWENDLPPNHTAGGVNLDFFPVGPLMRRTGVFFIRRSFKDNRLYKLVLQAYIDYLVEKRFPLEWYMEGGRSRSGKLAPPRFGLLNYVVDSLSRGKADDLILQPVSITYDQIQDVPDYTREAQGRSKEKETLGWVLRAIRSLRRRYGDIHIRLGEPISVKTVLEGIDVGEETSVGLQKLAFEVMHRIAGATPVTPIAIVSIALLAARGKARTADDLAQTCRELIRFLDARAVEMTEDTDLGDPEMVDGVLDWLGEHGALSSHEALGRRVFWLDDRQMIQVSYYRNTVVHYFVNRAIGEIAMDSLDGLTSDPTAAKERMLAVRDLLKFEFFFAERDEFLAEIAADMAIDASSGPVAHWALLPFLDAYQVVGDELESLVGRFNERRFLKDSMARARMYRIEDRLISGESASHVLFKAALALAANRGLLEEGPGVADRRADFAAEVRETRHLAARGL